jgi:heptosyltransferase I
VSFRKKLPVKKILIVKLTSLGDVLYSLPVVGDLKCAFPGARIDWAVDARFVDLVQLCSEVERVYAFPLRDFKWALAWTAFRQIWLLIKQIRHERYDVVIDLQGMTKSAAIVLLSGAQQRWGSRTPDMAEKLLWFAFNRRFGQRKKTTPIFDYRARLADITGLSPQPMPRFSFRINPEKVDHTSLGAQPYVVFFPYASKQSKRLNDEIISAILAVLSKKGFSVVIPSGSQAEQAQADRWLSERVFRFRPASIKELAQLFKGAIGFVGADTGLTHLAAALAIPTLAVFSSSRPERFGPHLWAQKAFSVRINDPGWESRVKEFVDSLVSAKDSVSCPALSRDRDHKDDLDRGSVWK